MNEIIKSIQKASTQKKLKEMWIKHLGLVWSYAKGTFTKKSDVDLVYEKIDPKTFSLFDRFDVQDYLKKVLKRKIDLISKDAIHPLLKKSILSARVDIF